MLKRRAGKSEAPRIYAYEYYQRIYEFEERHWWSIGMRTITGRLLDRHLQDRQHRRILDVGCGTGSMLSWLERYADPQRIVGIDLSRHALGFCQERRLRRLAQASITQLPFPDECFDLVTCADVLQHLPRDGSDRQALVECRRVLRPGGLLYVRTNVRLWGSSGNGEPPPRTSRPADFHQYSREELVVVVTGAGFELETLTYANMLPALVATWMRQLSPSHAHVRDHPPDEYRGLTMRVPPVWLNAPLKLVLSGEGWYLASPRRRLPYGHSLLCVAVKPHGQAHAPKSAAFEQGTERAGKGDLQR